LTWLGFNLPCGWSVLFGSSELCSTLFLPFLNFALFYDFIVTWFARHTLFNCSAVFEDLQIHLQFVTAHLQMLLLPFGQHGYTQERACMLPLSLCATATAHFLLCRIGITNVVITCAYITQDF
jgi:hypothetical protein